MGWRKVFGSQISSVAFRFVRGVVTLDPERDRLRAGTRGTLRSRISDSTECAR